MSAPGGFAPARAYRYDDEHACAHDAQLAGIRAAVSTFAAGLLIIAMTVAHLFIERATTTTTTTTTMSSERLAAASSSFARM